jgi:hypothetical protein
VPALAVCGLLAAAACQPLPRPFAHDTDRASTVIAPLSDSGGVVLRGIDGLPGAVAAALERAMIDALAERNIPAATEGGNVRSRYLTGTATLDGASASGGPLDLRVTWALADRMGRSIATETARMTLPRHVWTEPEHKALAPLADGPAAAIAALMQDPAPDETVEKGSSVPLYVWPVAGVTEERGFILRRAMEAALARHGLEVTDTLRDDGLVISGSVALGAEADGHRPIEVEWILLAQSGEELGSLDQRNSVPVAAVERGWAALAEIIADTAAPGVGALLDRLPPAGQGAAGPAGG